MKPFLLFKDRDFKLEQDLPFNFDELIQDLELDTLIEAMSSSDDFLYDVIEKVMLIGTIDINTIRYRQEILKDCLANADIIRLIYQIPIESMENKKKHWLGIFTRSPSSILDGAVELMQMFYALLKKLRQIADEHADKFKSKGFTSFFSMIKRELTDEYFVKMVEQLDDLKFREGVLISSQLGKGLEGKKYTLRKPGKRDKNWFKNFITQFNRDYSFYINERDDAGFSVLSEIKDQALNQVANTMAQSTDHVDAFLNSLRTELAFYIGCINLKDKLMNMDCPVTFPKVVAAGKRTLSFRGLFDVSLSLTMNQKITGNDVNAKGKNLIIITGANQGGKSTFLRSVGLAQLMMQSGMYVCAEEYTADICHGLFTHYRRKEDISMESGKLDEEFNRMSKIADSIKQDSMILFNESFSATNEREGSGIARQITQALMEKRIKVFFVTHLYDFANSIFEKNMPEALFLRAERKSGGKRTYKLGIGEPLQTSFGEDVYMEVFNEKPRI